MISQNWMEKKKPKIVVFKRHTLKGGGGLNVCMQSVVFTSHTCSKEEEYISYEHQRKTRHLPCVYCQVTDLDCTITGCSNNTTPIVGENCIIHIWCMATKLFQHLSRFEAMDSVLNKEKSLHSAVAKHLIKVIYKV